MTHPLLELQAADTMADQLRHRRKNLAEREHVQATRAALVRWDQSRAVMRKRLDELADIIERSETDSRGIDQHRERLQRQMRTVIAPREAEALQHEIATLDTRRNALDDDELAALEEQARIDDDLSELLSQEAALRAAFLDADAVMSAAETDIDGELVRTTDRIATLRGEIDAKTLKRYDRLREHHLVAAATLSGSRCDGCHLDLSAHEVDDVKEAGEGGGLAECPQCGRILIV